MHIRIYGMHHNYKIIYVIHICLHAHAHHSGHIYIYIYIYIYVHIQLCTYITCKAHVHLAV